MVIGNPCVARMLSVPYKEAKKQLSYRGIVIKSFILLVITVGFSIITELTANELIFGSFMNEGLLWGIDYIVLFLIATFSAAFVFLIGIWLIRTEIACGPLFAAFLGLMAGFFSMIFHEAYSLVVFSAIVSAIATLFVSVVLYAYEKFRFLDDIKRLIYCALAGLVIGQVLFLVLTLVFPDGLTFFSGKYWLQLLISLFSVASCSLAANQTLNALFESAIGVLPKKFEWLGAVGVLFSLLLMHVQFLRVFSFVGEKIGGGRV